MIQSLSVRPIDGIGSTKGRNRQPQRFGVSGTARLRSGVHPWTVVVKVFIVDQAETDPERTRPDGREYWKREWHVYRSDWQPHLPGPFRAARRLGSGEFHDPTVEVAWIALEDRGRALAAAHGP